MYFRNMFTRNKIFLLGYTCRCMYLVLTVVSNMYEGTMCRYWDINYYRRRQMKKDGGMNFVESVIRKGWLICSCPEHLQVVCLLQVLYIILFMFVGFLICIWWWGSKSRTWRREVEAGNFITLTVSICVMSLPSTYIFILLTSVWSNQVSTDLWHKQVHDESNKQDNSQFLKNLGCKLSEK